MRRFGVCQQIHCLTLSQLLSVGVLLYTVAVLMGVSVELVFVVDDVISVVLPIGIYVDLSHLTCDLHSIYKSGDDEIVSPIKCCQSNGGEDGSEDGEGSSKVPFKERINSVNDPACKDHHKKVLRQIICGDDLKEGGGYFLHSYWRRLVSREIKSARGMS